MITTNTYLNFPGTCEEAFKFYEKTFGGKIVALIRNQDMPMGQPVAEDRKMKIVHVRMTVGDAVLMASDAPDPYYSKPQGFSANIGVDDVAEAERIFAALAQGGSTMMPIQETEWAHRFGMCTDRFGTPWMVNCEKLQENMKGGA